MLSTRVYFTIELETEGEDKDKNEFELERVALLLPRLVEGRHPKVRINLTNHPYIPVTEEID